VFLIAGQGVAHVERSKCRWNFGLEGLVYHHLKAWNDYSGHPCSLHFWRTTSGKEVDFVVYGENEFLAIETKNATRISSADLSGLKAFGSEYPDAKKILLYRGTEQRMEGDVPCLPCERFLRALIPGQPLPDRAWQRKRTPQRLTLNV